MGQTRAKTYYIVQGTSEPQDYQLLDDGEVADGTGFNLDIVIYNNGELVTGPTVAWLDQTTRTVRVSAMNTLGAGEYHVRYTLTDGTSKVGFVPGGPNSRESDTWVVVPAYA